MSEFRGINSGSASDEDSVSEAGPGGRAGSAAGAGPAAGTGTAAEEPGSGPGPGRPRAGDGTARRRRTVVAVAVGALLLSGGGVAASAFVKSPAQVAADTAPPERDVLTAPVEQRVVTDTVVTRGTVTAAQSVPVTPVGASGEEVARQIVTKVKAKAGGTVRQGEVLLEVSARPLFVLKGAVPVYRDLKPGARGDDVAQVQKAFNGLGHSTGSDPKGTYGPGTQAAVRSFYRSIGYDPLEAEGGEEAVSAARTAEKAARRALEDLEAEGTGGRPLRYAREDLAEARQALTEAEAAAGPVVPASEVVFLKAFPARVDSLTAQPGSVPGERLMVLSAGELVVRGSLDSAQKGLVRRGQRVRILSEATGAEVTGRITMVSDTPGTPAAGGAGDGTGSEGEAGEGTAAQVSGFPYTVKPDKPLPPALASQDVRLTVEAAASEGKVLVVPVSAVSAGVDGTPVVTVYEKGQRRRVPVRTGTSGDGYVEVRPETADALAPGARVIVGVKPTTGAGG
ncbi:peptidoglycan-binding protein [Streptomyces sp. NPDC002458]|uniref:peptidoglycan-binding protein n=1 Tax=Streptomyces sp. NPDC002458 TaxID=3364644 RepID=UPI00369BC363